jgi:ribosomal protein L35AE/L33A
MPQYKHILTDFKDLRKVIGEVTKSKPAKTQYQQQAEKMGYKGKKKKKWNEPLKGFPGNEGVDEAEAQPGDQKKAGKLKKMKDHAGEEEIKKAYIELGTAAQGSVEFQRKLIQKKLKEMGYNTYSKLAFDTIFNRPLTKEDLDTLFSLTEAFSAKQIKKLKSSYSNLGTIDPSSSTGKALLDKFGSMPKDQLLDIAAAGINFLSLLAASNLISRFGMKAGQFKFQRAGDAITESKMGDLLIDIQMGATAKELARDHNISLATAKNFLSDYYGRKRSTKAPGLKKEVKEAFNYTPKEFDSQIKSYKYKNGVKFSQVMKDFEDDWDSAFSNRGFDYDEVENGLKQALKKFRVRFVEYVVLDTGLEKALKKFKVKFSKDLKNIDEGGMKRLFQDLEDGASAQQISKKYGLDMKTAKRFVDDYKKVSQAPRLRAAENDPLKEVKSRSQRIKEEYEHAKQSPFKLKSEQVPRAIAINDDGYGKRHATVEDIITACDSFGMIIDKELQVEQIQKVLGKKGFITYNKSQLEDIFEERETERMILALESIAEEQEPIEYVQGEVAYAQLHEQELEFLKPDGQKAKGPILKMSGNTFNIKDKFTGKSFTYKYSGKDVKLEEGKVKTFKEVTQNIKEVELSPNMLRKDFPNVWATKDSKLYRVLTVLIDLHGFTTNLSSYKKDKKDFLDSLRSIAKSDANMRKAGFNGGDIRYIKTPKPDQNFAEDIQEGKFSKQLIKQAGGIAFDKRYYMGNMSGAVRAIEKLKKGLSDDPKVKEMLRIANESEETTDYTNWLPEGGDKEAYKKFFNAALKKFGVSSPDELEGEKKKKFFDYVDKNWKGDHEEVEQDVHKSYKVDGRRKNFREKMKKLGYIKGE